MALLCSRDVLGVVLNVYMYLRNPALFGSGACPMKLVQLSKPLTTTRTNVVEI